MKKIRKLLSVVLCLCFVLSMGITAMAATETESLPVVFVPGIATSSIYADKNDAETKITIDDKDVFVSMVKEDFLPSLLSYCVTRDTDALAKEVSASINKRFALWFNNSDGTAKDNSGAIVKYPAAVSKNSFLVFDYDWRGDALVIAKELDSYINYVTEKSGCDKVALSAHSLGNIVVMTYLSIYGNDKVSGWVMDTPVIEGVSYVGDMLRGEIDIPADKLLAYLEKVMDKNEYDDLISSTLGILDLAEFPEMLSVVLDGIFEDIMPTVYKESLLPLFGSWLSVWAMVEDDEIEETMNCVFGEAYKDEDMNALKAKIALYNESVRKNKDAVLSDLDSKAKVAVISRYGFASLPVNDEVSGQIGDQVVETKSSSLGASTSSFGTYFADEYLEGKDMNFISPDRTVDASSCRFPEKTWFIKNLPHGTTAYTRPLYTSLLFFEEEANCDNFSLGRFSYFNAETGEITKDTSEPEEIKEKSPLMKLFSFLYSFFARIFDWVKKAFTK